MSEHAKPLLSDVEMLHFTGTDHKAVYVKLNIHSFPRVIGLWKFNGLLLEDEIFVDEMVHFIKECKNSLIVEPGYTERIIWDLLKISIRDKCIAYVRTQKVKEWGMN